MDDLWQVYYDSQYCPERKNLAAFHSRMPRRDQEAAGLRLVQNKKEVNSGGLPRRRLEPHGSFSEPNLP